MSIFAYPSIHFFPLLIWGGGLNCRLICPFYIVIKHLKVMTFHEYFVWFSHSLISREFWIHQRNRSLIRSSRGEIQIRMFSLWGFGKAVKAAVKMAVCCSGSWQKWDLSHNLLVTYGHSPRMHCNVIMRLILSHNPNPKPEWVALRA